MQGVYNSTDGYLLTDPVIHCAASKGGRGGSGRGSSKLYGATDKGEKGIRDFFATHTCNALCKRLGLTMPAL